MSMSLRRNSVKVLSITAGHSIVVRVRDIWCYLTYKSRGAWHSIHAPCDL